MKLLFDENLSVRLTSSLQDVFPGSTHVNNQGLQNANDTQVWEFAKENEFTVVSKDSDFHQRSFVLGHPPKVIWLRLGNCSTKDIEQTLRNNTDAITQFSQDEKASFLVVM